jgi:hypothetical protein
MDRIDGMDHRRKTIRGTPAPIAAATKRRPISTSSGRGLAGSNRRADGLDARGDASAGGENGLTADHSRDGATIIHFHDCGLHSASEALPEIGTVVRNMPEQGAQK